jgi:hypothetical protein
MIGDHLQTHIAQKEILAGTPINDMHVIDTVDTNCIIVYLNLYSSTVDLLHHLHHWHQWGDIELEWETEGRIE